MLTSELYLYLIKTKKIKYTKYLYALFAMHELGHKDKLLELRKDGKIYFNIDEEFVQIEDSDAKRPLIIENEKLIVTKDIFPNIENETLETTYGRALLNYIVVVEHFNDKIKYFNREITPKDVEKEITKGLKDKTITINEFLSYADKFSYIEGLERIINIASTPKNITEPDGLDEYKKSLSKEYNVKYGDGWRNEKVIVAKYIDDLKAFYREYLKDDPSYGMITSGKIINNANPKMFLAFGAEVGFDKTGREFVFVEKPLSEGYPTDAETLAVMYNTSRAGSFDRGQETQKSGATAKYILRATSASNITDGDCKTKKGLNVYITKNNINILSERYIIVNGKSIYVDDPKKYIGKKVIVRSPKYCIRKGSKCGHCSGAMRNYKEGINLLMAEIAGIMLNASMKSMHNSQIELVELNIHDVIF